MIAGRYRIERKLGTGGMGIVVAAIDEQTGFRVAIKLLLPEGPPPAAGFHQQVDDSGVIERSSRHVEMSTRLIREASAASRLSSEHVTRVLDVGRMDGGDPYVVMELLEGVDLNQYAKQRGPLPVIETVHLVLQACEAIYEAHSHGIVHRDLKPANLFLTRKADGSPFVKVLDFGISKVLGADDSQLTQTSDMLGSPLYMAPEQIRNARDVDARADVWSIGTILYRLLGGRAAFEGPGSAATLAAIIGDAPYPLRALRPDLPPDLESIILRCLEKDRTRRIQTVRELAIALQRFTVAQTGSMLPAVQPPAPLPAAPPPPPPPLPSFAPNAVTVSAQRGRSPMFFAAMGIMIGALLAGGALAWRLASSSASAEERVATAAAAPTAVAAASATVTPASSSEPAPTTSAEVPSGEPSASTTARTVSAGAKPSSSAAAPAVTSSARAPRPSPQVHGRPSDDPLGDRL